MPKRKQRPRRYEPLSHAAIVTLYLRERQRRYRERYPRAKRPHLYYPPDPDAVAESAHVEYVPATSITRSTS